MRISGITIPNHKRLPIALTALYGVGQPRARLILENAHVAPEKCANELTQAEESRIREAVEKFPIEGDLKRAVVTNIKRLKDIGTYRGTRHSRNLPVRGQRTKTNSRTVRGNVRKTMGSGKRKVEKT